MTGFEKKRLRTGLLFISPWLIGFLVFTMYPVMASIYYSLCDYDVLTKPIFIGALNYRDLFSDAVFWQSLYNTLAYAVVAVPLGILASLIFASLLNCDIRCRGLLRAIYFLPSLIPVVAGSIIFMWIFDSKYGLLNYYLHFIGVTGPDWLTDSSWTKPSIIMMSIWGIGNSVVIYLAALQDVPRELYEAARIDGASAFSKFKNITIPMISPSIYFNVIMGLINALQIFAQPFVIFQDGGGPGRSAMFYSVYLYCNAFLYNKMGYACAMAWIMFIVILALTFCITKMLRSRIHYGG